MQQLFRRVGQVVILGSGLLCSCNVINTASEPSAEACPAPPDALPAETTRAEIEDRTFVFNRFDYAPKDIVLEDATVRFRAREYDFVYCRADGSWTVQPGTIEEVFTEQLADRFDEITEFASLEYEGESYQYRVIREPNPDADYPQYLSAFLELIVPGQETPQQIPLYTFEEAIGPVGDPWMGDLGAPRITSAQVYGDRLWLTVAFAQGEGLNGVATIISYDPATEEVTLIQPPDIASQQIVDLAFTGTPEQPTLWLGMRVSGEGISAVPAMGLVAYRPAPNDITSGTIESYTPHNSPLIGHIPTQLAVEDEVLWVGTRNGVCQLDWQASEEAESWDCWRFYAEAQLPEDEPVSVYPSLLSQDPTMALTPDSTESVEVLWWLFTDNPNDPQGRYEIRLEEGVEATITPGASPQDRVYIELEGQVPMFWPGRWWHWQGDRFARSLDGHLNSQIGGDHGIGPDSFNPKDDWYAMRGDFDLLDLSEESAQVRYYSGWVEDERLTPSPAVVEQPRPDTMQPNPLVEIDRELRNRTARD
ncbi:hypothetical protein [Vacuolonema iberomarrocanum]|uniref:hypothetical protein n=1 Tax=Vacuolonema iberomarrocanum TaxID=3454632 RepID=UPI001A077D3B|nr:hypothetical protein [filamentous cyanobacterium LEGE 07170]